MGVRESLEAAFEAQTGGGDGQASTGDPADSHTPEPAQALESSSGTDGVQPEAPDTGGAPAKPAGDEGRATAGRTRDATGKFVKGQAKALEPVRAAPTQTKAGVAPPAPSSAGDSPSAGGDSSPVAATPEVFKAPQSWTPGAREAFAKAPPEVQREVAKREREIATALQEAAPARRLQQEVHQALAPLAPILQARGIQPAQLIQSYVQADQQLSSNDQATKAAALARLIKGYGLDDDGIKHLAKFIDSGGQPAAQQAMDPAAIAQQVEQRVFQGIQSRQQQMQAHQANQTMEEFRADPKHEFFDDVRHDMAGIMEAAAARGLKLPLDEVYSRAVWSNPELRAIVQQREAAEAAKAQAASTQRARNASVSVKTQPAGLAPTRTKSIREALEEAAAARASR